MQIKFSYRDLRNIVRLQYLKITREALSAVAEVTATFLAELEKFINENYYGKQIYM